MADHVTVISSDIVQPGNISHSDRAKIHLIPSDLNLLYFNYIQRDLLFPKPDPETLFVSQLKSSLSTALEIYFPFAGRLVKINNHEDNTVSFYIDCNDVSSAKFIHAIADSVSVSDILQPDGSVPKYLKHFFPANGVKSIDGISEPLLALQVTEIKDGIFISFAYNHLVADGSSIWKFFNDWSKICLNGEYNWVRNVKITRINVGSKMGYNSLVVNSSLWFQVLDNDFGFGKPLAARAGPANGIGNKFVVFPGIEEGCIDVHANLSLWSDELLNLLDDIESMENVATS